MSSVTVCNCPQNTPDPACLWAVSSRLSDQQQKKPDGSTCWASSVERRLDDCWLKKLHVSTFCFTFQIGVLIWKWVYQILKYSIINNDMYALQWKLANKYEREQVADVSATKVKLRKYAKYSYSDSLTVHSRNMYIHIRKSMIRLKFTVPIYSASNIQ